MKDYSHYALLEAVNIEIVKTFVASIRQLDSEIAEKRLQTLLNSHNSDAPFALIVAGFNAMVGHKTSAD